MSFVSVVVKNPELVEKLYYNDDGLNTIELFDGRTFEYEIGPNEDYPEWFHNDFPNLEYYDEIRSDGELFIDVSKTPNLYYISSYYVLEELEDNIEHFRNIGEIVALNCDDDLNDDSTGVTEESYKMFKKLLPEHSISVGHDSDIKFIKW